MAKIGGGGGLSLSNTYLAHLTGGNGAIGVADGQFSMVGGEYETHVPDSTIVTINKQSPRNSSTYHGPQIIGVKFNPVQSKAPHTRLIGVGGTATQVRHAVVVGNTFLLNPLMELEGNDRMSVDMDETV